MERIEREYAIIYVDRTGESLTSRGQATRELISDYYNQRGFLQWNFYLIIAEETIEDVEGICAAERIEAIKACDEYSRKYVMPEDRIEDFIEANFPVLKKKRGKIEIIQAEGFREAKAIAGERVLGDSSTNIELMPSLHRDYSLTITLTCLDGMRIELIRNSKKHYIFYSHIQHEISLAEKKFKLFLIKE